MYKSINQYWLVFSAMSFIVTNVLMRILEFDSQIPFSHGLNGILIFFLLHLNFLISIKNDMISIINKKD